MKKAFIDNFLFETQFFTQGKAHNKTSLYLENFNLTQKSKYKEKIKKNLRPKWIENNHLELYNKYFTSFSFTTFHTFSYLSEYLAPIYYNYFYDEFYYETYMIKNNMIIHH